MASYISSNNNRFYVGVEAAYGQLAAVSSANRIPAVKLGAKQQVEKAKRQDKTGTRTFWGDPSGLRASTSFSLKTYMTAWADQTQLPPQGPLFQGVMGGAALVSNGTIVASNNGSQITFAAAHGLVPGQAISAKGEVRFVAAVVNPQSVQLNAPFSIPLQSGINTSAAVTYQPADDLPSISIYDYWSPVSAVQRTLCGVAVNQLTLDINGDYHEFEFSGMACDLIDSASFQNGQGGLASFPPEPAITPTTYSLIPGHLGQAWLGSVPSQFFTVTKAQLTFNNNLTLRDSEFGTMLPQGITPGIRDVSLNLTLYQRDDSQTAALYQAARQRSPISVMLQLGQAQGQLFGLYMSSVVPEVPQFEDNDKLQQWTFQNSRAQGGFNNEIFVAFA